MAARRPTRRFSGQPTNLGPDVSGDPLSPEPGDVRRGAGWTEPGRPVRERGRIVAVDANRRAYRVVTLGGRSITCLRIQDSPQDHALLPIGTDVRVDWSLGVPYIDGVLPGEGDVPDPAQNPVDNPTGTDGFAVSDPILDRNYGANGRPPGAPTDVLPGDFVRRSPDGATVGAYHGQLAMLHGGHLAQLLLFGGSDRVELIAGLLRIVTWMGESKVVNEDGRTSFIWRGGASQLAETGADENRYTVHLDVGATGNLVNLRVTTIDQQTLFQAHVTREGRIEVFGGAGLDATFGNRDAAGQQVRFEGPLARRVAGDAADEVNGNRTATVDGDASEELANNWTQRVGNDWTVSVNRNGVLSFGGGLAQRVVGDENRAVGGNATARVTGDSTSTVQGAHRVEAAGENVLRSTGDKVRLECHNATMEFDAAAQTVQVTCGRVEVSGATNAAVLFNQLRALLQAFLQAFATHTHEVVAGGAVIGQATPSAAAALAATQIGAQLPGLESQKMKLGA